MKLLLEPAGDRRRTIRIVSGPDIRGLLDRGRSGYHVCFEVSGVEQAVERFVASGAPRVMRPAPALLFGGRLVCFLSTPIGLVEFLEGADGMQHPPRRPQVPS